MPQLNKLCFRANLYMTEVLICTGDTDCFRIRHLLHQMNHIFKDSKIGIVIFVQPDFHNLVLSLLSKDFGNVIIRRTIRSIFFHKYDFIFHIAFLNQFRISLWNHFLQIMRLQPLLELLIFLWIQFFQGLFPLDGFFQRLMPLLQRQVSIRPVRRIPIQTLFAFVYPMNSIGFLKTLGSEILANLPDTHFIPPLKSIRFARYFFHTITVFPPCFWISASNAWVISLIVRTSTISPIMLDR